MGWEDQQPQWGKKKPSSPEEIIAALLKKIKEIFEGFGGGKKGNGEEKESSGPPQGMWGGLSKIAIIIGIIILVQLVMKVFYKVEAYEKGVVLRFGEYVKTTEPGLNFMIPLVDEVIKVDVENYRKEEFGFRTKVPGQKTIYEKRGYDKESLMLTGDKNVIDVEWIVQYKVMDPVNFVFKVRDVRQSVRDISEAVMRRVVGNQDFDYALSNRDILEALTKKELQTTLNTYESGVDILNVKLQDVNPPDAVKPAFNEVNEADQDMKRLVNEAEETYNRVIPKARGSAKRVLEESQGYAVERVNLAKGETSRFESVLTEYLRAKEVTRKRLYLETMEEVIPTVKEVYVIDSDQKSLLPLLDLSKDKMQSSAK